MTCKGILRNGPGKRYCRCDTCHAIDWEGNEGDRCRAQKTHRAAGEPAEWEPAV